MTPKHDVHGHNEPFLPGVFALAQPTWVGQEVGHISRDRDEDAGRWASSAEPWVSLAQPHAHRPQTSNPNSGNRPFRLLSYPTTRPCGYGTHLSCYLGPRPARSRLSPNDESEAAASVVDERGHLTCLRHANGGPAAAQCSRSGARGPDGSRAARRRSSALQASSPYVALGPSGRVRVTEEKKRPRDKTLP